MKTKPNLLFTLLSISILLLTCADRAAAAGRNIIVDFVTVTVSSLNTPIPLTSADTILVRNGGTLFVDANATVGTVTIGDAQTPRNVVFTGSNPLVFTVSGDVALGPNSGNLLDMTLSTAHTIQVGGNFISSGAGTFRAGAATIEYNSAATSQNVTANVGGNPAFPIQYKNLTLSGTPSVVTNSAIKNFATGVSVQGTLTIAEKAIPAGGSVTYGALAALVYSGSVAQTTTPTEWPAAADLVLPVPVTINNASGVTLDSDKSIGAISPVSLTLVNGTLNDNGKTLTVLGNILNGSTLNHTALKGSGKLVLTGNSQVLAGIGNYGNVVLNNNSTSSLPVSTFSGSIIQPLINGRLTIQNGKLALPSGTSYQASLLTYGGSDKAAGTFGASTSSATTKTDTVFDSSATGVLIVNAKPTPTVSQNLASSITYGAATVTVSGSVTPPTTTPNFADYGNGALNGEVVSNVVFSTTASIQTNIAFLNGSGGYSITLATTTLPAGSYTVFSYYKGGINLSAAQSAQGSLTVNPRPIGVIPDNGQNKVFSGTATTDPTLTYTITNSLVPPDTFSGALHRAAGENVGTYAIDQGTLALNGNYVINFTSGKTFAINKLDINVTMVQASKVYGANDPALNRSNIDYTITPQLVGNDAFSGALGRTAGEYVAAYPMNLGTLSAGGNYNLKQANQANFTITPLAVTVNFDPKSKTYGDADPQFTYTFSPALAFSDTWNASFVTNRDGAGLASGQTVAGSPYIIRPGTLNVSGGLGTNYNLTFSTQGKLTINKKAVTVTALSPSMVYGATVPALVNYAGFITQGQNGVPPQTAPTTPATLNPATPVTSCSPPITANYPFTITDPGSDPNYVLSSGNPAGGTVTVTPAPMVITAQNQTKAADNNPIGTNNYPVNYNAFVCSDTTATAFSGTLNFAGTGATVTNAGVYPITPRGLTSTKYNITFVSGWVTITVPPATVTTANDIVWTGPTGGGQNTMSSMPVMVNQANGTAGANPGWSLFKANSLTFSVASGEQFRLDIVSMAGNVAGLVAKFDPTRPFSWEIVRTVNGISGFDATKVMLNYAALNNQGANLFLNPLFNGVFSLSLSSDNKSMFLNFTPMGSTGGNVVQVPGGYDVGTTFSDTTKLLGNIYNSDVDELWLQPSATTITPQTPLTVNLNVANLKQSIIGVDAYINFDSRFFVAGTGAGAPQVVAGGGAWNNVIVKTWNTGGDLDTVVAVQLTASSGTTADGTVAQITLTPTKTATGKSRVVFRADGGPNAAGTGSIQTDLVPFQGTAAILPGRVMTDEITINSDTAGPTINSTAATQTQPYAGSVNVKNGDAAHSTQVVRTSTGISDTTVSGPVVITIDASDAGVGLSGAPTLTLKKTGSEDVTIACDTPSAVTGPFVYHWNVPGNLANGTWSATIVATDTILPTPNKTTVDNAFTLTVNTTEVSGVAELDSFAGTNRVVTFKSGGAGAGSSNQWDLTLNFISGPILNAGAYQNTAQLDGKIKQPTDSVSIWLRGGTITDLPTLAFKLANQVGGVSKYIYGLEFGSIANLSTLANQLYNPQRPIDVFVVGQLSPATVQALIAYHSNPNNAAVLTQDLLVDFNTIVLGPNIYTPVRFAGVCQHNPISGSDTVAVNRGLLEDAYATTCTQTSYVPNYVPGQLKATTAQRLAQYAGGTDATLAAGILADFDTLTLTPSLWPTPVTTPYDIGLYNQTIFLGVTLSPATTALLQQQPSGNQLTLLNQLLLQDAYAGQYQKAPLAPATVQAAFAFNSGNQSTVDAFTSAMTTDLNTLIMGGTSIYSTTTFASFLNAIQANAELVALINTPNPTPQQLVRENRLLLETAYDSELSKSVLSTFRLVQVPATATQVSAKTAWNLRVTKTATFTGGSATLNFVNDGVPGFTPATDFYLRGGDITGDNIINLFDYNVLRSVYTVVGPAGAAADINGDGRVNISDYSIMQVNFGKQGDSQVSN